MRRIFCSIAVVLVSNGSHHLSLSFTPTSNLNRANLGRSSLPSHSRLQLIFGGNEKADVSLAVEDDTPVSSSPESSNKFDMMQRLESVKCAVVGAVTGSLAAAPVALIHYASSLPQWEFTTDMAAIQGALFAIVYRYAIREDDNPQLNQGVVGAFVLTRTLANVVVSSDCSALPLQCKLYGSLTLSVV